MSNFELKMKFALLLTIFNQFWTLYHLNTFLPVFHWAPPSVRNQRGACRKYSVTPNWRPPRRKEEEGWRVESWMSGMPVTLLCGAMYPWSYQPHMDGYSGFNILKVNLAKWCIVGGYFFDTPWREHQDLKEKIHVLNWYKGVNTYSRMNKGRESSWQERT